MIQVGVAYATSKEQIWKTIDVDEGASVLDAIENSGILNMFPEIKIDQNKVGIFGQIADLTTELSDGDRVEIYRPIKIIPESLEKRKYKLRPMDTVIEKAP